MLPLLQQGQLGRFLPGGAGGAGGAFPVIEGRQHTSADGAADTTHAIALPSGISAGELLLVCAAVNDNPAVSINTGASGSNWNALGTTVQGTSMSTAFFWKIAEGGDVLTLTLSAAKRVSTSTYRISGASSVSRTAGAFGVATTSPDPLEHIPAGGLAKYLWLAFLATNTNPNVTAFPADYINTHSFASPNSTGGASYAVCERELEAASEDPGPFTISVGAVGVRATLSVAPA